jgi:hypothetical protein
MSDYLTQLDSIGTAIAHNLDISIYDPQSEMYQIYLTGNLAPLNGTSVDGGGVSMGTLSKLSTINLDDHTKDIAGIPTDVSYWAWAYPIIGVNQLTDAEKMLINPQFPEVSFAVFGGFVYFDSNFNLVQVNAVFGGNNISFQKPKTVLFGDIKRDYYEKGRFQDVTSQTLKDRGIINFCWVTSDDTVKGQIIAPLGGFMYMYEDKYIQFFEISTASAESVANPIPDGNSPFSIITNYLKIIDTDYESELDGLNEKETILKLAQKCKKYKENLNCIQDIVICKMCSNRPIEKAYLCGHMFCEECIKTINGQCPHCRAPISQAPIKLFFC